MTDRELLELAAKAGGIPLFNSGIKDSETAFTFWDISNPDPYEHKVWNPLHDDHDAMSLMHLLKIEIAWKGSCVRAIVRDDAGAVIEICEIREATGVTGLRRIITMAAASIQLQKEKNET